MTAACWLCSPSVEASNDPTSVLCAGCRSDSAAFRARETEAQAKAAAQVDDAREADNAAQARDAQDASDERAEHQALCWYCLDFVGPDVERRRRCRERKAADSQRAARRVA